MSYNESQEMYLETILRLQSKKGSIHAIDVAMELNYSKPSVSRAVGILKKRRLYHRGVGRSDSIYKRG